MCERGHDPRVPSSSPPPSNPYVPVVLLNLAVQLPGSLPWSIFTNPFTGAPITTSPAQSSVASVVGREPTGGYTNEIYADRFLMEMGEGLGFLSPRSLPGSFKTEAEGRCDRFDLTGYTFPALPQQSESRCGCRIRTSASWRTQRWYRCRIRNRMKTRNLMWLRSR